MYTVNIMTSGATCNGRRATNVRPSFPWLSCLVPRSEFRSCFSVRPLWWILLYIAVLPCSQRQGPRIWHFASNWLVCSCCVISPRVELVVCQKLPRSDYFCQREIILELTDMFNPCLAPQSVLIFLITHIQDDIDARLEFEDDNKSASAFSVVKNTFGDISW
jgi:hypothetical protein